MGEPNKLLSVVSVLPADARQQLRALEETGLTTSLVGLGCIHRNGVAAKLIKTFDSLLNLRSEFRLRNYWIDEVDKQSLHSMIWPVALGRLLGKLGIGGPRTYADDLVCSQLDLRAAGLLNKSIKLVLGREDSCIRTFEKAKDYGATCVLDLPAPFISTVRELMSIECEEFPDASNEISESYDYAPERIERKTREMQFADRILVASQMTERSVLNAGIHPAKIVRIPYGCEPPVTSQCSFSSRKPVILFVGGCSLRKGIPRLLRVWKRMKAHHCFTLRLIGNMVLSEKFLKQYRGLYEHIPTTAKSILSHHYSTSYCLVFPTVADGFGLVVNEALSHALPIIASSNNGAPGFIEHGRQGLIYKHANDDELAGHLEWVMSNPNKVEAMSHETLELAKSWTWNQYRSNYATFISSVLNN